MKFNLKLNKKDNNFSANGRPQYITVVGTRAVLKNSRRFSAAENDRKKCPLSGICTPEKNCCQNAPVFHGGSEDINDAGCTMRKGQAPGFVSNRGDFTLLKLLLLLVLVFLNSLSNFAGVPHSIAEWRMVPGNSARLHPGRPGER